MSDEQRLHAYLTRLEAKKRRPYLCPSNKWTIGVGRNLEDNPLTLTELLCCLRTSTDEGLSDEAITLLLANDIETARGNLRRMFLSFNGWPPARQAALISIHFTTGFAGLLKFGNMVAALHDGRWADAARELLDSRRSRETLARSPRDEEEARMIETGEWDAREGRIV